MPARSTLHQPRALGQLQRALRSNRLPHAFMFHGPEGTGRELAARELAATLLCPHAAWTEVEPRRREHVHAEQEFRACGACPDCHLCEVATHPDLHEVHRFLNRFHAEARVRNLKAAELSVAVVRQFIIEQAGMKPSRGRAKIFIVRQAERLSRGAENALLKTLEEPPPDSFIVLITASPDELLPTTRSRCTSVAFDALPCAFVLESLKQRFAGTPPEPLEWAAGFAAGSLGRAIELMEDAVFEVNEALRRGWAGAPQEGALLGSDFWLKTATALGAGAKRRDEELSDTEAQRMGLKQMIAVSAACLGDALRLGAGAETLLSAHARADLAPAAARWSGEALCAALDRLRRAEVHLDMNANMQLSVETMVFDVFAALRGEAMAAMGT